MKAKNRIEGEIGQTRLTNFIFRRDKILADNEELHNSIKIMEKEYKKKSNTLELQFDNRKRKLENEYKQKERKLESTLSEIVEDYKKENKYLKRLVETFKKNIKFL